jgi:hypothetical protein
LRALLRTKASKREAKHARAMAGKRGFIQQILLFSQKLFPEKLILIIILHITLNLSNANIKQCKSSSHQIQCKTMQTSSNIIIK